MIHVLDSNIFVAFLRGDPGVHRRLETLHPTEVVLCAPVLAELKYGARYSDRQQENLTKLAHLVARMRCLAFAEGAAQRFGDLKADLRRRGITMSDFDLAIAVIALDVGATLVSDDRVFHDFPIPGLTVENWLKG